MVKYIYKLERKRNCLPLFFSIFFLDLVFNIVISYGVTIYNPEIFDVFDKNMSLTEIFILSVIIAPLMETFLFQYLIIEILYKFKTNNNLIILVSAVLFALIHDYNLIYILLAFLSGIIYASYYLYLKLEKQKFPFLYVWAIHSLYNFSVFILDDILGW